MNIDIDSKAIVRKYKLKNIIDIKFTQEELSIIKVVESLEIICI